MTDASPPIQYDKVNDGSYLTESHSGYDVPNFTDRWCVNGEDTNAHHDSGGQWAYLAIYDTALSSTDMATIYSDLHDYFNW